MILVALSFRNTTDLDKLYKDPSSDHRPFHRGQGDGIASENVQVESWSMKAIFNPLIWGII
jgi:hypothetical protein